MVNLGQSLDDLLNKVNETLQTKPRIVRVDIAKDQQEVTIFSEGVRRNELRLARPENPDAILAHIRTGVRKDYDVSSIVRYRDNVGYFTLMPKLTLP